MTRTAVQTSNAIAEGEAGTGMNGVVAICKRVALTVLAMACGFAGALAAMLVAEFAWLAVIAAFLIGVMLPGLPQHWPMWAAGVGYCLVFGVVGLIAPADGGTYSPSFLSLFVVYCIPMFVGSAVSRAFFRQRLHRAWAGPVKEPRCPQCGYILYHAEGHHCPECGRTFGLHEVDMRLARLDGETLRPRDAGQPGPSRQVQANVATPAPGSIPPDAP